MLSTLDSHGLVRYHCTRPMLLFGGRGVGLVEYLLLAEVDAALNLSWGAIVGIVTALIGSAGAGLKILWSYWTKREDEKRAAWTKVVDDKDVLIALKDARIAELSKMLSEKSDDHAEKIQELMGMTLTKVEEWSLKQGQLLDRALTVQAEFTTEVRRINLDPGSGSGALD